MAEIVGYDAEKRRALLRWGDRMSHLPKLCLIPREALQTQFGTDYGRLRDFKRKFLASAASRGLLLCLSLASRCESSSGSLGGPGPTVASTLPPAAPPERLCYPAGRRRPGPTGVSFGLRSVVDRTEGR